MQDQQKKLSENDEDMLSEEEQLPMEPDEGCEEPPLEQTVQLPDGSEGEESGEGKTRLFDTPCGDSSEDALTDEELNRAKQKEQAIRILKKRVSTPARPHCSSPARWLPTL